MDLIRKMIRLSRPNIKDITIKNYVNYLNRLSKDVVKEPLTNLNFLKDVVKVQLFLDAMSFNSRRSTITAVVVALKATMDPHGVLKIYDALLMKAKGEYSKLLGTKHKSDATMQKWTTMKKLLKIQKSWRTKVMDNHIPDKEGLTTKNHAILQNYLIASLYTLIPPRRNIYGVVKLIKTTDFKKLRGSELKDNFLVFSNSFRIIFFHFGDQKSETEAVLHARQKPPKKLRDVIELYLRFNHGREYLLVNNRGGMLGQDGLGRTLLKLFGIGSTMIRKIYISEHTKDAHNVIESLASKMGHSATMARASYLKT